MLDKPRKIHRQITELVIGSHNQHKFAEFSRLLSPYQLNLSAISKWSTIDPVEDGETFTANAKLKAHNGAQLSNLPTLADDSGLCIPLLNNWPGVLSARFADAAGGYRIAFSEIQQRIAAAGPAQRPLDRAASVRHLPTSPPLDVAGETVEDTSRNACFHCSICIAWPDGSELLAAARVDGKLIFPARGSAGFGYDAIFCPASLLRQQDTRTFAQLASHEKDQLSHRKAALDQLAQQNIFTPKAPS